jgi:uncharacterized integral membrane protein
MRVRTVVAGVLVVLALVFVFQNTSSRRVHFLFWSMSMPAWIWLLIIFAVGVTAGSVFPWLRKRRA